ncbi:MAG: hypothetical protein AAFY59_04065 [Pseudomonadota bacterium]
MQASVLLIHGLARSPISLWPMDRALTQAGFSTIPLWYKSHKGGLREIAERLAVDLPAEGIVHAVGHSLGGLLALDLMARLPEARRGRIVQLGSPNLGSPLAARAHLLKPLFGPILADLEDGPGRTRGLDICAIAGTAGPVGLGQYSGIHGPNDGVVTVKSALAAAPRNQRTTLPVLHSFMMLDGRVIRRTERYLKAASHAGAPTTTPRTAPQRHG